MVVLVTGAAGFIGYNFIKLLLSQKGYDVIGVDSLNAYYDVELKKSRLTSLGISSLDIKENYSLTSETFENFKFYYENLMNKERIERIFENNKVDIVVHLAAQAGVRYSITHPHEYISNNITAFYNIIDLSKNYKVDNFFYASSSSVYGDHEEPKLSEDLSCNNPLSLYAATKKSNEVIANAYNEIYGLSCLGMRFFTVYGPYGRPDMALFMFTRNILENQPIDIYNYGKMSRDFTYVDDVVSCIAKLIAARADERIKNNAIVLNIGNGRPIGLKEYVDNIESVLGIRARRNLLPMQLGDVKSTYADNNLLKSIIGDYEITDIETGITRFVEWYTSYYKS